MTRRVFALAILVAAMCAISSQQANAFGFKKRTHCDTCATPSPCATECAPSYSVTYVDKKVTAYKTETEVKDVKVTVNELVEAKVEYKYIECVPVTTKTKVMVNELVSAPETYKYIECVPVTTTKKVMTQVMQTKQEPYKYTEMVLTPAKEIVKVCNMVPVTKDVEVTIYECVPVVTKQKRVVCETICVPVTVTCTVPVAAPAPCGYAYSTGGMFGKHCCKKKCESACVSPCPEPCAATPCYETVTRTVMQRQVVSKEIEYNVTSYTQVPKKVMQKVTTYSPVWTDKEVVVSKCVPVEKTAMKTVCFYVPVEKEVPVTTMTTVEKTGTRMVSKCVPVEKMVDVTTMTTVEKTGTRTVMKCVPVEKMVKQTVLKTVPYETTIKVAVYTPVPAPAPVPAPCATPCDTCAPASVTHIGHRLGGGILHGCCHKCK